MRGKVAYMCVCVCVCVHDMARATDPTTFYAKLIKTMEAGRYSSDSGISS